MLRKKLKNTFRSVEEFESRKESKDKMNRQGHVYESCGYLLCSNTFLLEKKRKKLFTIIKVEK